LGGVQVACDAAWIEFQESLNEHYVPLRGAVRGLAALDALQSLALVSSNPGYANVTGASATSVVAYPMQSLGVRVSAWLLTCACAGP
jgi:hypothetical protein